MPEPSALAPLDRLGAPAAEATRAGPGMRAVLFGDAPRRCAGWLQGAHGDVGVVLCAPLGADEESAHRSLLHLAHALASLGIPALRFDYPGTGDSEGDDPGDVDASACVDAIVQACDLLRERAGCRHVGLVGLRLGAALAGMACARAGAGWLALWAPVSNGRAYARELRAVAALAGAGPRSEAWVEVAGHVYDPRFIDALAGVGARQWELGGVRRILLLQRDDAAPDIALQALLQAGGVPLDVQSFAGYLPMMDRPHASVLPAGAIAALSAWFEQRALEAGCQLDAAADEACVPAERGAPGTDTESAPCWLRAVGWREQRLRIEASRGLAGVLCLPSHGAVGSLLVLLLNAGAVHHIGPGRLYVRMARELARSGVASLRVDLSMLGDSIVPGMDGENDCYAASGADDALELVDHARHRLGFEHVVLGGLCSGAYWALQAAVDPRAAGLRGVAMINPLLIAGRPEAGPAPGPDAAEAMRLRQALRSRASWKKLLGLRARPGAAMGVVLRRAAALSAAGLRNLARRAGWLPLPPVARGLQRMRAQQVTLGLFVGTTEPGWQLLRQEAPRELRAGEADSSIRVFRLPESDHTFSADRAKRELFRVFGEFIQTLRVP